MLADWHEERIAIHQVLPMAFYFISREAPMFIDYLKSLEAESIHILRETVATFDNPVMLYSAGKDSCVMMHLAMKAFYPGKPPFPFLHVDTTWKFKEMIAFRGGEQIHERDYRCAWGYLPPRPK